MLYKCKPLLLLLLSYTQNFTHWKGLSCKVVLRGGSFWWIGWERLAGGITILDKNSPLASLESYRSRIFVCCNHDNANVTLPPQYLKHQFHPPEAFCKCSIVPIVTKLECFKLSQNLSTYPYTDVHTKWRRLSRDRKQHTNIYYDHDQQWMNMQLTHKMEIFVPPKTVCVCISHHTV